jgi:luciferase family oxidoreductase group 1
MVAAYFGAAFSFAHFISGEGGPAVMEMYRREFRPSRHLAAALGSIGVFAICAETQEEAEQLAQSRDLWRLRLDQGHLGPVPSIEEAAAYPYSREERLRIDFNRQRMVIGTPLQAKERLTELAASFGVDEVVVVTICYDFKARLRSYELLAEAFDLPARR